MPMLIHSMRSVTAPTHLRWFCPPRRCIDPLERHLRIHQPLARRHCFWPEPTSSMYHVTRPPGSILCGSCTPTLLGYSQTLLYSLSTPWRKICSNVAALTCLITELLILVLSMFRSFHPCNHQFRDLDLIDALITPVTPTISFF